MIKNFIIKNKTINIYYNKTNLKELPVVLLNTYNNEGQDVFNECINLKCNEFILVSISNLDWDNDLSPWFATKLNKNDVDCLGKADDYIDILVGEIIPKIEECMKNDLGIKIKFYAIAGYSLAGLFAVYCAYKTEIFTRIASASGSFWFPKFVEFIKNNTMSNKVDKIYFSLGDKESKVKNKILATVENNTKEIENIYNLQGIKTIYEQNKGNHFQDGTLRMAKGINWILK